MATRMFISNVINNNDIEARKRRNVRLGANRESLTDFDMMLNLNTYKNFGIVESEYTAPNDESGKNFTTHKFGAVRSLFNRFATLPTGMGARANFDQSVLKASNWRKGMNMPLLDTPTNRIAARRSGSCTVRDLVDASKKGQLGRGYFYQYSDFMYCKHLGKLPNTYLITLRRFPIPILDSMGPIGYGKQRTKGAGRMSGANAIGQLVTWMGVSGNDMKSIMKYDYHMAFKEQNSQWEQIEHVGGGDSGVLNFFEALTNSRTRAQYNSGYNVSPAADSFMGSMFGASASPYNAEYLNKRDRTKVYGPVDRVKKIYTRSEEGLDFNMNMTLVFEYELKAYNGINPKTALLDLISNILSVTYTTGTFWGGDYWPMARGQSSSFRNLNIFKCNGTFTDYMDAIAKDLRNGFKHAFGDVTNLKDALQVIGKFLNNLGGMIIGGLLNGLGRPAKYWANSLLTDAPAGLWHVTIGNPMRPIMTLGNLILTNTTVEHSGPLGLDDFPTNLKVTCELKRGRPRDQILIENMYMLGNDRITHSQDHRTLEMYQSSVAYKNTVKDAIRRQEADQAEWIQTQKINEINEQLRNQYGTGADEDDPASFPKEYQYLYKCKLDPETHQPIMMKNGFPEPLYPLQENGENKLGPDGCLLPAADSYYEDDKGNQVPYDGNPLHHPQVWQQHNPQIKAESEAEHSKRVQEYVDKQIKDTIADETTKTNELLSNYNDYLTILAEWNKASKDPDLKEYIMTMSNFVTDINKGPEWKGGDNGNPVLKAYMDWADKTPAASDIGKWEEWVNSNKNNKKPSGDQQKADKKFAEALYKEYGPKPEVKASDYDYNKKDVKKKYKSKEEANKAYEQAKKDLPQKLEEWEKKKKSAYESWLKKEKENVIEKAKKDQINKIEEAVAAELKDNKNHPELARRTKDETGEEWEKRAIRGIIEDQKDPYRNIYDDPAEYEKFAAEKDKQATTVLDKNEKYESPINVSTADDLVYKDGEYAEQLKKERERYQAMDTLIREDAGLRSYLEEWFGDPDAVAIDYAAGEQGLYGAFPKRKLTAQEAADLKALSEDKSSKNGGSNADGLNDGNPPVDENYASKDGKFRAICVENTMIDKNDNSAQKNGRRRRGKK